LTAGQDLKKPWYYIYSNREVLLYVDQNGPVKVQYQPPNGILVFKREMGENQSKWQVWVSSSTVNGGIPVSNFASPELNCFGEKPKSTINWTPEKAVYTLEYENATIITELSVPCANATVCMKTIVINKGDKTVFTINPSMFPYVNVPQMVAWDLPEWYLTTTIKKQDNFIAFCGQMKEPTMDKTKNRSVTLALDYEENAGIECDMVNYVGAGNFFIPDTVKNGTPFATMMKDADGLVQKSYQAVYTAKYSCVLEKGQSKTFTQVLTIQNDISYNQDQLDYDKIYFDMDQYNAKIEESKNFYSNLFSKRKTNTSNPVFNKFINEFAPLQMNWVSSLDRGWPSQQRGIRDTSQDCMGLLQLNENEVRKKILELFEHQTSEGWFYKQMSTVSRSAPHDMRKFCDGGAFVLELVYEYLAYTRDESVLWEKTVWLDSDKQSTILEHVISCMEYYVDDKNIGEHGLCKSWHGDWYDIIDGIGDQGRGESVTVTAQTIINLGNLVKIIKWLNDNGKALELCDKITKYQKCKKLFSSAMQNAYNSDGYYNGYFNDNGKWILGNSDPDGQKKVYLVSNAWAILSNAPNKEQAKKILEIIDKESFGRLGYNVVSKPFKSYVEKAGRMGSLLLNNSDPYNHATSFLVRACCASGNADMAYKATRYIFPIEEDYAPCDKTFAPPFTIANSYNCEEKYLHRVELQYLSGTVSYVLRNFYSSFCGINYSFDGLVIKPCLPRDFGDFSIEFDYLGKKFTVNYCVNQDKCGQMILNGVPLATKENTQSGKNMSTIKDGDFKDVNVIDVYYY